MNTATSIPTNLVVGTSKTVHNAIGTSMALVNGEVVSTPRPSCSVGVVGKTITETDAPITCKACAKHAAA